MSRPVCKECQEEGRDGCLLCGKVSARFDDAERMAVAADVDTGLLCCEARRSGFKLALVVGYPTRAWSTKLMVSFWRAQGMCWTQPRLVDVDRLQMLTQDERTKRAALIRRASEAAQKLRLVRRVW